MKKIRQGAVFNTSECVEKLTEVGFEWDAQKDTRGWAAIKQALQMYLELYGNLNIPFSMIVPAEDPWPKQLWSLQLGARVSDIRAGRIYLQHKDELDQLGFIWNPSLQSFEKFLYALRVYRQQNGHIIVPTNYRVPSDKDYPEDIRGFELGQR